MLNGRNLVIDTMAEQYDLLKPYVDHEFWDFATHEPVPNSVYLLGRQQTVENIEKFKSMALDGQFTMIFGNSAEGSSTLLAQIEMLGLLELIKQGKVLLISGGDMDPSIPYLMHDHFLIRILNYKENLEAQQYTDEIFDQSSKPYKFLFLNGRARPHRKYLWERFRMDGLLDQSIWTMLDGRMAGSRLLRVRGPDGRDLMDTNTPIQHLPVQYEVDRYRDNQASNPDYPHQFVKNEIFNNEWGEIYLNPRPYIDTYFSVITETVLEYPHSFRTEKIAKVLAMGHPWICATSRGFYRDLRNMGFRTFNGIVDESFDSIDDTQARMDRVHDVIADLCQQDLSRFLEACRDICKYNQQHLAEIVPKIKADFPQQFFEFVNRERP